MFISNPNAATVATNISQFGGTAISTGQGVGGAGIPRVTIAKDSLQFGVMVTSAPLVVPNAGNVNYAPNANCMRVIFSNLDTALSVYIRDQAAATDQQGILLAPRATATLETNAALRLTNGGGTSVTVTVNEIRSA